MLHYQQSSNLNIVISQESSSTALGGHSEQSSSVQRNISTDGGGGGANEAIITGAESIVNERAKPIEFEEIDPQGGLQPIKQESNFFTQEEAVVDFSQLSAPQKTNAKLLAQYEETKAMNEK